MQAQLKVAKPAGALNRPTPRTNALQKLATPLSVLERRTHPSGQSSLHTTGTFAAGEDICAFKPKQLLGQPTMYSVQVSEDTHIELDPEILRYANHSCAPSVFFDTAAGKVVALTDLQAGDEVTFFYPSTEFKMSEPFSCGCGSSCCLGTISGAAHIDKARLQGYRLNKHISDVLLS
ncbi:hypothetical protein DUNSADRAFT_15181 [Dunaliella salina]|uniref:Post-SET domain-containing protein n=1 Tax=Dunaliella salina TaxID=3046 RepID=A0ABQ7G5Z4_DUNSA|nr:hypothetical protein DUNSADRAFT_15181 [Dunaliella salina]|eukprot:KAF5830007.1 hypothetical protein DUNSADRAFT_15181 [Dunaliella salina]